MSLLPPQLLLPPLLLPLLLSLMQLLLMLLVVVLVLQARELAKEGDAGLAWLAVADG